MLTATLFLIIGLTLHSGNEYSQKVEKAFHVSMAALDVGKIKGGNCNRIRTKAFCLRLKCFKERIVYSKDICNFR